MLQKTISQDYMKAVLAFLFLFFNINQPFAQQVDMLVKEAHTLELHMNEQGALEKFKDALVLKQNDVYLLSKCSELFSRIGARFIDASLRDSYYSTAKVYAEKALKIDPKSDMANVAMAIVLGKSSLTKSGKEKIKSAKMIKTCAETALRTNPSNFVAWHILGRWHYEVSNVGAFERMAAKVFFGSIPEGSFADAIRYLEKARTLNPKFLLNYLELAKAYHKNGNDKKAIELLSTMIKLPNTTLDDAALKVQAKQFIQKWN